MAVNNIELKIYLDDKGMVNVSGNVPDKVVAMGLLECAKDALRDHFRRQAAERESEARHKSIVLASALNIPKTNPQ